ncbi:MAG TPA: PRC-barrel domain-containing protein [Woeseiaceae bacterium]|nr:PRC-barrel domain-containing protein [Woeseiaceae bacterium]
MRSDSRSARADNRKSRNDDRNARGSKAGENILTEEQYDEIYSRGMSAEDLLDADVVDAEGDIMGEVEDLIVGPDDNRLIGMVVETGGFLEIGDSHLLYPFDKAQIMSSEKVQVPNLDGEQVEELSLYQEIEGKDLGSRWRVTELIGSFAYAGGEPYGRIEDVVVDKSGDIMAVVVEPDVMYEDYDAYYAWPYAGYYYDPVAGIYDWPIGHDHVFGLEPFEPL